MKSTNQLIFLPLLNTHSLPYQHSVFAISGKRPHMEDEYYIGSEGSFAAVFDGHGGNAVSRCVICLTVDFGCMLRFVLKR